MPFSLTSHIIDITHVGVIVDDTPCHALVIDGDHHGQAFGVINIHGYFASGAMYRRESEHLARSFGWTVANIDLPGFGSSPPLDQAKLSLAALADRVEALADELGFDRILLIGHSMGASIAIELAQRIPERIVGIIYRAGIATPSWQHRDGLITRVLSPIAPEAAPALALLSRATMDVPDLLVGRMVATARSLVPDLGRNVRRATRTLPIGSLLLSLDQRDELRHVVAHGIPLLGEWGCFDYVIPSETADEFSQLTGVEVQWVPGGHSWMLARPTGQRDVLAHLSQGQAFMNAIEARV